MAIMERPPKSTTEWAARTIRLRRELEETQAENARLRAVINSLLDTHEQIAKQWRWDADMMRMLRAGKHHADSVNKPSHPLPEDWEQTEGEPPY